MTVEAPPATTLEIIDPHWMTAAVRDDRAVIVRRCALLDDDDEAVLYPQVRQFVSDHGYVVTSSKVVAAEEMYGRRAVVRIYEPSKVAA